MKKYDVERSYDNYIVPGPSNVFEKSREMVIKNQGCIVESTYTPHILDNASGGTVTSDKE